MHAAIWLPHFHLQAAMRHHGILPQQPAALLDGDPQATRDQAVLREVNHPAQRQDIQPGMTAPQAQARCPRIMFLHPEPEEEARLQTELEDCAAACTPFYEATLPGLCLLDLTRLKNLRGNESRYADDLYACSVRQGQDTRIGLAPQPDLAMLAAQAAQPVLVLKNEKQAQNFLHGLPITALRPSAEMLEVLRLWGIHSVGQFVRLRRPDVAARLGTEGALLWDIASGGRKRLLQLVRPPLRFQGEMELEHGLECLEPLLVLLRRLLESLCERLREAWLVAAALRLVLRFEDQSDYHRELRVAEPCRDVDLLTRLLQTHLEGLKAKAPIIYLSLQLQPIRPPASQGELFARGLRDPNRFAETLSQLEALLGADRVGRIRLLPSRRKDAFALDSYLDSPAPPLPQAQEANAWSPHGLPLRHFRPAPEIQVRMQNDRPVQFHWRKETFIVREAKGPWLLSGEWWDTEAWQREIWTVAVEDGGLYQLAFENGERWVADGVLG
jgi:protein ImuB